ncbi:diacylglycerol/polyprenol kinase family protein [Methanosarcina sp. UBA289]|uniref:diacylglycerol/polyprenol kinase family protein n=1 Tax=Methanosarcina sp. UBA289 TaxID=1915574 RepID=UPI0025D99D4B|nr:diacylglycerol/polyprenol kinase family protein [Methanosarcina sp. UBA289]
MANKYAQHLKCNYLDRRAALRGEVERQLIHLFTGITLILLIDAAGDMALPLLLLFLIFYVTVSIAIILDKLPLPLSIFLCRWGRPSKQTIPLKGTILLLCGILLSFILFPEEIMYASIVVVTFGDSVATALGVLVGKHKLPYSREKTIEGTVSGIVAAFLVSLLFVTPVQAFVGATGGMLLESVIGLQTIRESNSQTVFKFFFNDNFLIPLFSGLLMFIVGLFSN